MLIGKSCEDQEAFDDVLLNFDNSSQKINIGGNVTTALSIANYLCANFPTIKFCFKSSSNTLKIPKRTNIWRWCTFWL